MEHASFTPLVLSASVGMANQATIFYKRLVYQLQVAWQIRLPFYKRLASMQDQLGPEVGSTQLDHELVAHLNYFFPVFIILCTITSTQKCLCTWQP